MNEEQREGRDLPIADSPTRSLPDMLKLLLIVIKRIFSPAVHSALNNHPVSVYSSGLAHTRPTQL